jgi:carboxypeptidase Q
MRANTHAFPALLAGLALALSSAAHADETRIPQAAIDTAIELREQALAGNPGYAIIEELTTVIGARMPGTEADARAVEWAKAKFEALGFDRVSTVPVTFDVWLRGEESAEVLGAVPQPLKVTALGGSIATPAEGLQAEVVEFPNLQALTEAPDGSLDGKIAYISNRMQRFRDGRGYGPAVAARSTGAVEAARKGAVGLLIRSISTAEHRFPHTGQMRYADDVERIPAAALANPDADQLSRLIARGEPISVRLKLETMSPGEYTSYNVIGDIIGRETPEEMVVIGAHLDSWDLGTGALDDGAGIGITFAAGHLIGQLPERPRRTVRVIAFAAEEIGLLGARAYAEDQAARVREHVIAAESDFGAGRIYALRSNAKDEAWGAIEQIGEVLAPLGIDTERGVGGPGPDIIPMATRGVTWAQLAQDGTLYFDYHHTADDTLDKIDAGDIDQQVAAYAVFAWLAAEAEGDFGSAPPSAD